MKIHCIVLNVRVLRTVSVARTIDAFRRHGIAMEMTIVVIWLMSHQNIVNLRVEPALAIYSLVIMATVYLVFTFVMVIMTAWITVMKMIDINAVSLLASFYLIFITTIK